MDCFGWISLGCIVLICDRVDVFCLIPSSFDPVGGGVKGGGRRHLGRSPIGGAIEIRRIIKRTEQQNQQDDELWRRHLDE